MTHDTRTPDEIERDIFEERTRMSDSINSLQKKFSVDAIVDDIGTMFRTQGGELGRTVSQTVGRNPAAVALVGIGLAWLFLGQDRNRTDPASDDPWANPTRRDRSRATNDSWDRQGFATRRQNARVSVDREPEWYGDDQMAQGRTSRERSNANDTETGGVGSMKAATQSVRHIVSDAASSVSHAASDLTTRLSHGLKDLSEEARSRVLAARRAAHDAREASAAAMKKSAQVATNFFEDQPLVVGALAVALGAAMGGVLPHTRIEDEALGASSDKLFAEAQAIYREEKDKALAAVRMAAADLNDEVKNVRSDLEDLLPEGKTATDVVVDRAADAASRVYGHALSGVDHAGAEKPRS